MSRATDMTIENLKMLDEIDFTKFFDETTVPLYDLRRKIEDEYDNTKFSNNEVMEGCVFNWISDCELVEYLEKRYPKFRAYEVIEQYYYIDD